MTTIDLTDGATPAALRERLSRGVRRTFDALSSDEARVVLEVRPDPVATIRRSGPNPYRVLCFGGGVLRGTGLRDHEVGLPGRIAERVAARTGRGVQLDVVVEPEPTKSAALAGLAGLRLRRYDAVVLVLGDDGAAQPLDQWRGAVVGLTRLLVTETCGSAGLFVYESGRAVADPVAAYRAARSIGHAARRVEVTEEVCSLAGRVRFAELRPILGGHDPAGRFSDATLDDWADLVAGRLEPAFAAVDAAGDDDAPRAYRNRPQHEAFRQRAVQALRLRRGERDARLDREMEAVRSRYRVSGAAITVIDGATQWSKASTRDDLIVLPREASICHFAVGSDELTLINDTLLDGRARNLPTVQGAPGVRFYAGYPVHSPDGYRVGMVCIYGTNPRTFRPSELEGLRDTAARVEQYLWNEALRGRTV